MMEYSTMQVYVSLCVCAITAVVLRSIISNIFFSPLSSIPGPLLAKATQRWLVLKDVAGLRTQTIHTLHKRYGPIVRIAPNEISFSDLDVIDKIYGQATPFMKAPIYDEFSQEPVGIFSMRDKDDHRHRRRLLSHAFAQSNLLEIEPVIADIIRELLGRIDNGVGRSIDTLKVLRMFALDVVGELFVGKSFGALASTKSPAFIEDLDALFLVAGIKGAFPWLFEIASYFPLEKWQNFQKAPDRLRAYGVKALEEYRTRQSTTSKTTTKPSSKRKDLLAKILPDQNDPNATHEGALTDSQISMEIGNLVFAGTDTTSTTLTYLFWQLAQCEWQDLLREELSNIRLVDGVPSFADVDGCKILNAVIQESLRLFPAAPASLQRVVPAGGRELSGRFVPAGTIVSMQCYTTQRDPAVFPDPEHFDPTRWMLQSEKMDKMNLLQMPFSRGTRACLGKNLAMMELKLVVVSVIKRYTIRVADSMKPGDMDMRDHFLTLPKCGRCDLVFERL